MENFNQEIFELVHKKFPRLSDLTLQKEIARVGFLKSFKAGEVLLSFGSYVKVVPLVVKGSIKVVREDKEESRELLLYYLYAGETCSMSFSCCMMDKRSAIRATAEDDSTVIVIPIKYVDEWMSKYPTWRNFVMRSYDFRMKEMIKTIDTIAFNKMDERLLNYLNERSVANSSKIINSTHQEIAADLNASREAISRLLKKLEINGLVTLERNKINLL
jgi:CRP/FNR family transcriptional regulator